MKFFVASLGLLALLSSTSFGNEPQDKAQGPQPARAEPQAEVIRLPTRISALCEKAKGDTATICAEYETLYMQVEREKVEARKRLQEITRGGVAETLN